MSCAPHRSVTSETACRGRGNLSESAPACGRCQQGDVIALSCADRFSAASCWDVGRGGEPMRFQASNALLWSRSIR